MSVAGVRAGGEGDFDFLVGNWRVRHECLIRCKW
jgi:hypothetical protein